ncbi:hypothetical protein ACKKBG_A00960 [Auxenochlorella protothecoides x Auxenochlorella symbiontica]
MDTSLGPRSHGFPRGLRVLLVETEPELGAIASQLTQHELGYTVTSCTNLSDAMAYSTNGPRMFDVILANGGLLSADDTTGRSFVDAFFDVPIVAMSDSAEATKEAMHAVELGAVDLLSKPLSMLKLKNIWQHSVRMMMATPHLLPVDAMFDTSMLTLSSCSSLDLPCTPSAEDTPLADVFSSSFSAVDFSDLSMDLDVVESTASFAMDQGVERAGGVSSQVGSKRAGAAQPYTRPPLAFKPSSFGPLVPIPPVSRWPQLPPGCVWGTPADGPLPPPLPSDARRAPPATTPAAAPAPLAHRAAPLPSIKVQVGPAVVPVAATSEAAVLPPPGFLKAIAESAAAEGGPLGLTLRKSSSLLSLCNQVSRGKARFVC